MMPAAEGNKYAEKWTKEAALEFLGTALEKAKTKGVYHLGGMLVDLGHYPQLWAYLSSTFKQDKEVFEAIKKVESALEAKIVQDSLTGDIKGQTMAIFYLKNKHGYVDKQEVDQTVRNVEVTVKKAE